MPVSGVQMNACCVVPSPVLPTMTLPSSLMPTGLACGA